MVPMRFIRKQINAHQVQDSRQNSSHRTIFCTKSVMRDISDLVLLVISPDNILIIRILDSGVYDGLIRFIAIAIRYTLFRFLTKCGDSSIRFQEKMIYLL